MSEQTKSPLRSINKDVGICKLSKGYQLLRLNVYGATDMFCLGSTVK